MSIALVLGPAGQAFSLTELKNTEAPATEGDTAPADDATDGDGRLAPGLLPLPDPLVQPGDESTSPDEGETPVEPARAPEKPANVEVLRDISKAPEPVIRMRELIVEAAASGDIERLRALMKTATGTTQVVIGDQPPDPIVALKEQSGDPDGREILAILIDIMATGFVHVGKGTPDEAYVWPYFAEKDLGSLSPPEVVELLRIVTAGDMADMTDFGGYNFYRVAISPKGEWTFFLAGD